VPVNVPEPQGKSVDLRDFVDSNHTGEKTIRLLLGWSLG
jgi:hypothetical protein